MKLSIRIPLIAAAALALGACGGSGAGAHLTTQEDAANALYSSNQAYGSGQQQALVYRLAQSAAASASGSVSVTVNCRNGNGSVTANVTADTTGGGGTGTVNATVNLKYDGCEAGEYVDVNGKDGGAVNVDGSVTWNVTLAGTGTSFTGAVTVNGELDFSGGISDKLIADNLLINVTASSGGSGASASVTMTGTLKSNEGTFPFDGSQTITVNGSFSGTAQVSGGN